MILKELAQAVGGTLEGDGNVAIRGVASLEEAEAGDLTFLANPRYAPQVATTRAAAVLVSADWRGAAPTGTVLVRVANPNHAFMQAAMALAPAPIPPRPGVHPTAVLGEGVVLGADVSIGPYAVLEDRVQIGARTVLGAHVFVGHDSVIGDDGRLYAQVCVRERVRIGHRVILHHGAVIGADGFGYVPRDGRWIKIPQLGTVEIGDDVEIGANTSVDRARFGKTVIGEGVKLDNLIQIGHNARVGAHTVMAAQVGISGSASIGRGVQVGGQVGMAGHLTVGDGAQIGAQAGISKSIPPGAVVFGTPAMPMDKFTRMHMQLLRLTDFKARLIALEKRLAAMDGGVAAAAAAEDGES